MKLTQQALRPAGFYQPLGFYIFLSFLFSYGGLLLAFWLLPNLEGASPLYATYSRVFFAVSGVALTAIIVSLRYGGYQKLSAILQKLKPRGAYLSAYVLLPMLCLMAALLIFSMADFPPMQSFVAMKNEWKLLLGHLLLQIFLVGIMEEIGWRGWMLPHLLKKFNLAKATLILAPIWCLWHFPKILGPLLVSGPFVLLSLSASVILSYLWMKYQGNLFLLAVAHGSFNFPIFFLENLQFQAYLNEQEMLDVWLIYSLFYTVLALALMIFDPKIWKKRGFKKMGNQAKTPVF